MTGDDNFEILSAFKTDSMPFIKLEPGSASKDTQLANRQLTSNYKSSPLMESSFNSSRPYSRSKLLDSLQEDGVVDFDESTADEESERDELNESEEED
jgi:hypothetical protein